MTEASLRTMPPRLLLPWRCLWLGVLLPAIALAGAAPAQDESVEPRPEITLEAVEPESNVLDSLEAEVVESAPADQPAETPTAEEPPDEASAAGPADDRATPAEGDAAEETEWQLPQVPRDRLLLPRGTDEPEPTPVTSRELLELFEISSSQFDALEDGQPLLGHPSEVDVLLRLLYRYPDIPKLILEDLAHKNAPAGAFDWPSLATEPAEHRGKVLPLSGRVIQVKKFTPDAAARERYQLEAFYRVRFRLRGSSLTADVYASEIPRAWKSGKLTDMQSGTLAMFLKRGDANDPATPLVFVTEHIAWYRDTLLGDLGVDEGLFDRVKSGRGIVGEEREAFYQILDAVGDAGSQELIRYASRNLVEHGRDLLDERRRLNEQLEKLRSEAAGLPNDDRRYKELSGKIGQLEDEMRRVERRIERAKSKQSEMIPLLDKPSDHEGRLVMFRAVAQRITRVRVPDEDIIERFGIDHYYQIDGSVELEMNIRLAGGVEGEEPTVRRTYPVTFCARRLPEGMPTGENVHEEVVLAGFFFKNWAYYPKANEANEWERFTAPMLIGREPIWLRPEAADGNPYTGAIAGGLFVLALLGIWLAVWRLSRGDRKFQMTTLARTYAPQEGVSLNDLGLESRSEPDFRHMNDAESSPAADVPQEAASQDGPSSNGDAAADEDAITAKERPS